MQTTWATWWSYMTCRNNKRLHIDVTPSGLMCLMSGRCGPISGHKEITIHLQRLCLIAILAGLFSLMLSYSSQAREAHRGHAGGLTCGTRLV